MKQIAFYEAKLAFEIDSWDLSQALKRSDNIVVIDTRTPEAFAKEHIPSAINIPHRSMNEKSLGSLDRRSLFITYCDGIGCNASTKGALKLSKLGFKTKELLGGLDWWIRDGHITSGARKKPALERPNKCGC